MPLLRLTAIHKSYPSPAGPLPVLRGLDLEIDAGEIVALTGASGTGKTTLLNILGTMDRPDSGQAILDGRDIAALAEAERCALRARAVGFVFQLHHLLPEFTAEENVAMPLWIRGEPHGPSLVRARALLERLALADRARHRPSALSAGEQQRVALARAIAGEPRLLLADEPTGSLDPDTGRRVFDLLLDCHRDFGLTTVVATHNPELAARCGRVLRLRAGTLHPAA